MSNRKSDLIQAVFEARRTGDRAALGSLLADEFTFASPSADGVDKAAFIERCAARAGEIAEYVVDDLFQRGDEVVVLYKCATTRGRELRNTELFIFRGDHVRGITLFHGAAYVGGQRVTRSAA